MHHPDAVAFSDATLIYSGPSANCQMPSAAELAEC